MRRTIRLLALAAIALPALAQQPAVVDATAATEVATITAKVEAVDRANRVIMVTGALGRTLALKVDDRVRNLAQVKAGDEIVLQYVEAVSVALVKGGGDRSQALTTAPPGTAPAGARSGAAVAQRTKIVARIEKVGAQGVVLFEGSNARYVEVKVSDPDVVKELVVGEDVEVTYTDALVVDLMAQKK